MKPGTRSGLGTVLPVSGRGIISILSLIGKCSVQPGQKVNPEIPGNSVMKGISELKSSSFEISSFKFFFEKIFG